MRTLLDRKNFSSSSNDQVAAHRVAELIIKRLWLAVVSQVRSHTKRAVNVQVPVGGPAVSNFDADWRQIAEFVDV